MSEISQVTWEQGLEVAGQYEIDNAITLLAGLAMDRTVIPVADVDEVIDALLDRRNVLND